MSRNIQTPRPSNRSPNLSSIFERQPELLYQSPYINFLREFRLKRLHFEIPELYHEAALAWNRLSNKEQKSYNYKDVILAIKRQRANKSIRQHIPKKPKPKRPRRLNPRSILRKYKKKLYPLRRLTKHKRRLGKVPPKRKTENLHERALVEEIRKALPMRKNPPKRRRLNSKFR